MNELKPRRDGRRPNIMSRESHITRAKMKLRKRSCLTENGCLEYTGYRNAWGYGRLRFMGKKWLAPRLSWYLSKGSIPEGLCILHTCDNPACINPAHLFLGTDKDNTKDAIAKGRIDPTERAKKRWQLCPTWRKN